MDLSHITRIETLPRRMENILGPSLGYLFALDRLLHWRIGYIQTACEGVGIPSFGKSLISPCHLECSSGFRRSRSFGHLCSRTLCSGQIPELTFSRTHFVRG